jgi:Flp pilus assembly protein TadG
LLAGGPVGGSVSPTPHHHRLGTRLRWGRESGASAVEFALVLPLLLLIVFGTVEFGLAYNRQQAFHAAAREGARLVAVGYALDEVRASVVSVAAGAVRAEDVAVNVVSGCTGDESAGPDLVTVAVELDSSAAGRYQLRIPFIPVSEPTFRSEATFRCEVQP